MSDSMRGQPIVDAGMAVQRFVRELLQAEDEAFIGLFNHRPRLGFTSSRPPDGTWRTIRVRVHGRNYLVRARQGCLSDRR